MCGEAAEQSSSSHRPVWQRNSVQNETSPAQLLQVLERNGLKTAFPNVFVALSVFITLPVWRCEGERSSSVLKRVKHELRTTMSLCRHDCHCEDIVHQFAHSKSRKRPE